MTSQSDIPESHPGVNRWKAVVTSDNFVNRLNKRKSFKAVFGQRSMRGKIDVDDVVRDETAAAGEAPSEHDTKPVFDANADVEVRRRHGNFVVYSCQARNYFLEPYVQFKPSQFFRTALYELIPAPLAYFVVLFTETAVFGHSLREARQAAGCRQKLPVPVFPGVGKFFRVIPGIWFFANMAFVNEIALFTSFLATIYVPEVRKYIEPMEWAPVIILYVCRALVISSKYSLLPESWVSDRGGKMYAPLTGDEFGRTLVGVAWSDPKAETHTDFLRQEMARACLEADVDLSEVAIDVGSAVAARALRASARGVGARGDERVDKTPSVISGKELLAAITDTHIGTPLPGALFAIMLVLALVYASVTPACRAAVGAPAFGGSPASKACAAFHFWLSFAWFMNNMVFTSSMAWNFHRQGSAIKAMNAMMHYPGEPVATFAPPPPPPKKAPKKNSSVAVLNDADASEEESSESRAIRAAGEAGEMVLVDLKCPDSCLCWCLVRRVIRKIGSPWTRRLNLFSIIFLLGAFTSALIFLLLFYGVERKTHRLASAVSLFYLSCVISFMVSVTVLEGSLVNDQVPKVRSRLKREMLAMSAAIAQSQSEAPDAERQLRASHRLLKSTEAHIMAEEDATVGSDPVQVFYEVPATPAAVTFVISTLISILLIGLQKTFTMIESEGWAYDGDMGEFAQAEVDDV